MNNDREQFIQQNHKGMTARQIADQLHISRQAVQSWGDRHGYSFKPAYKKIKKAKVVSVFFDEHEHETWLI
jgi:uncharacterized protein YjcR